MSTGIDKYACRTEADLILFLWICWRSAMLNIQHWFYSQDSVEVDRIFTQQKLIQNLLKTIIKYAGRTSKIIGKVSFIMIKYTAIKNSHCGKRFSNRFDSLSTWFYSSLAPAWFSSSLISNTPTSNWFRWIHP